MFVQFCYLWNIHQRTKVLSGTNFKLSVLYQWCIKISTINLFLRLLNTFHLESEMQNIVDKCVFPFFLLVTGNMLSVFIRWKPEAWGKIGRISHLHSSDCSRGVQFSRRSSSCKPCADVSNTQHCLKHSGIWITSLTHAINLADGTNDIPVTLSQVQEQNFGRVFFPNN